MQERELYIGTYTRGTGSRGIYRLHFSAGGVCGAPELAAELENPSWITFSVDGTRAYAVSELSDGKGFGGAAASFAVQPDGTLCRTALLPTGGADPCHLCLDEQRGLLFAANYTSGSLTVFTLDGDGALREKSGFVQHAGHGTDPVRQEGPHLHFTALSPGRSALWTLDLGLDALTVYPVCAAPAEPLMRFHFPAGFGPRHLVFHPSLPLAYVVSELCSAVAVLSLSGEVPDPCILETVSTLPEGFTAASWASAVRIDARGEKLYVANRGHDSVAVFDIQPDGSLRRRACCPAGGAYPRDLLPVPGLGLLCANQLGGGLTCLPLGDGGLPGVPCALPSPPAPVCAAFAGAAEQNFQTC